ncbi:MAG TPA: hypothetical protein PKE27_08935 [Povalibacter sp.]|uniref:DUF6878 family protein n=1 Tax=Povalibacter sp. TaxID=1962978 RepID=UPI002BA6AF42|nr:DUF6878 family protein [Povalibacter sp.]HMN44684.1 hypothetical protein [Povalibacter sp.]
MSHLTSSPSMDAATSSAQLQRYERELLERVRNSLPVIASRLLAAGVVSVDVIYDGCGDSGQIERLTAFDAEQQPIDLEHVAGVDEQALMDLFYDLTQVRHPGWENNDGGCGEFHWTVTTHSLQHMHSDRIMDFDTTEHEGL